MFKNDKNIEFMQTKLKNIFKSHQIGDKYLEKKGKYHKEKLFFYKINYNMINYSNNLNIM